MALGLLLGCEMLRVLGCIAFEHNPWLVTLSALICILGCFTTTSLMARVHDGRDGAYRTFGLAATVFGCSVWSLHFVAMLAFMPAEHITYASDLTVLSAAVAVAGAFMAMVIWRSAGRARVGVVLGGALFALAVTCMHYLGTASMTWSSLVTYDGTYLIASVVACLVFFTISLSRASDLRRWQSRLEVTGWMALAIVSLHFTGMAAVTLVPLSSSGTISSIGPTTVAIGVGGATVLILVVGLAAMLVEQHMSQRAVLELGRMRLMNNFAQEVLLIHRDGVILEINSAGERLFRAPADQIIGRPLAQLFADDSLPILARRTACRPEERRPEEMQFQDVNGGIISVELSCQTIDYMGKPATAVAMRDLTDRKRDEAQIRHLARHDALTNLPNRHALLERLNTELDVAGQGGTTLAVVFIDLDRFKPVNDLYGHAVGDALLVMAAKRLRAELQPADMLARIGGDEFVMLLANGRQPERVGTRTLEALCRPFQIEGRRIEIGASIGIALYPDDGATADTLMRAADIAMYRVKEDGRGSLRFFEAAMNAQLQTRLQLEQELSGAAERGELMLYFQPIVDGGSGVLENFEALLRWNNPRCGWVPPIDFIPLAEQTGLIDQIGRWVIDTACREAASWPSPWCVSVNVSPKQFHGSSICDVIGAALLKHGLEPGRLIVEVTEGILIDDAARAVATLGQLRDMGVRIALDDFGTGFSSLNYLQQFRFDKLKIDKSFINKLGMHDHALTLTRAIVNLGHNLGLEVTAEGVETAQQLSILQQLGCDHIQGYLVGRPAMVNAFTDAERHRVKTLLSGPRRPPVERRAVTVAA